jgi:hypothetical protein
MHIADVRHGKTFGRQHRTQTEYGVVNHYYALPLHQSSQNKRSSGNKQLELCKRK